MPFEIQTSANGVGADVVGLDVAKPLDPETIRRLQLAMAESSVLRFRDQTLDEASQVAFVKQFGDAIGHPVPRVGGARPTDAERDDVFYITHGIDEKQTDEERETAASEAFWHSDLQYMPEPQVYSFLYAIEVPPSGGETEFCNMTAAYDALDDAMKARLSKLRAVHWYVRSIPAVTHPMVRVHPITQRKALYVSPKLTRLVEGMDEAEGKALLAQLGAHATEPRFVWKQEWRAGDAILWDNRCTMHRRLALDPTARRILRRSQTAGEALIPG